jgi:hypothetical protein
VLSFTSSDDILKYDKEISQPVMASFQNIFGYMDDVIVSIYRLIHEARMM